MAPYGPGQREVFFASTHLAFRSPMSPILEAGVSTRCLRIVRGIYVPEGGAASNASDTAYLSPTSRPLTARLPIKTAPSIWTVTISPRYLPPDVDSTS